MKLKNKGKIKGLHINKNAVFISISVLFLGILLLIYGYRFIHYYSDSKPKKEEKQFLSVVVKQQPLATNDGLVQTGKEWIFRGKVTSNYVSYSGALWRILKIEENGSMTLAMDSPVTSLVWGYETADYLKSYLRAWLNPLKDDPHSGIFYQSLSHPEQFLEKGSWCIDAITDLKKMTCQQINRDDYVGVLSLLDYQNAGLQDSFLNQKFDEWFINSNENSKVWFRLEDGKLSNNSNDQSNYYHYGVRPVVKLKPEIRVISGSGSSEKPYQIEEISSKKLSEKAVGSYVMYSNYRFRINQKNESGVQVVMDEYWKDKNGKEVLEFFSYSKNQFDLDDWKSLSYDLNHKFKSSLSDQDYLTEGPWAIGYYGSGTKYDYHSLYAKQVQATVGLLHPTDFFLSDMSGYHTLTGTNEIDGMVYTVQNGKLFANHILTEMKVRPSLYLKNELKVTSGVGSKSDPFTLSK